MTDSAAAANATATLESANQQQPAGFSKGLQAQAHDGSGLTVCLISARWNAAVVESLKEGCIAKLREQGVTQILELQVPGSYELSFASKSVIVNRLAQHQRIDAVVALGCLIKGETKHLSVY